MRILFYHWPSYFESDIQDIFHEKGISFDLLEWRFEDKNNDDKFLLYVKENICLNKYDIVFSVNYWPLLSVISQESSIPYIAWCYDNPLNVRDINYTLGNDVNHVYCFDRTQVEDYKKRGYNTVEHLPLGINSKRLERISIRDTRCEQYKADVSFVGKLYESAIDWIMARSDDYCKGYLKAIMEAQQELYGAYLIDDSITDSFLDKLNESFRKNEPDSAFSIKKEELVFAMASDVTKRERIILLSLMGTRFHTKFYSYDDSNIIKHVERCSTVDYMTQMPYVFAASKINLNPCLRAIQTGIPLRALDIMACGGFLLSNYQEELADMFVHEEEMVMYDSYQDAVEKASYYIVHDAKRSQITEKGRRHVLKDFDMRDRLAYMLKGHI